ncbi:HAD-IB family hydrolase [Actinotalea sp. C106]|uniref:HAD family hydrolase n=1 Tax=Actinotalea sp. C106 TaxID=2908644 RepID=UPI0027E0FBAC|nr:HAD-IB family hydrolase [Actinotalea sp. C106]
MAEPKPSQSGVPVKVSARAAVEATHAVPPPARTAAFFDLDNTIIRGASAFHLAVGLRRRGFFRTWDLVRFGFHQSRYLLFGESLRQIDTVRSRALSIVAGRSVAEITAIGEEVWDEVLSLRIFPGTQALLHEHLEAGHQVWIITASPVEIGELIGRRLGVTGALGTVAEHVDGFYTGRLVGDMLHGRAKAEAIAELARTEGLDLETCYAYGDSTHDVPILSAVGHPVAINPDGRLRRHANAVGWPAREFRGRRRVAARRSMHAASFAGVAWVAGLVLRAALRGLRG